MKIGRPLDPTIEARVLEATLQLLLDHGYAGLRIEQIVAASGVAKSTIYRRWRSVVSIAVETIAYSVRDRPPPSSGDPVRDLEEHFTAGFASVLRSRGALLPMGVEVMAQNDEDLHAEFRRRIVDPFRDRAIRLVDEAIQQGRIRPVGDPAAWVDAVIGGFLYRTTVWPADFPLDDARQYVQTMLNTVTGE